MLSDEYRYDRLILTLILLLGTLARLAPLGLERFHEDEALYSFWGLRIASGEDFVLSRIPVDKPPLFFYLQAGAFALFGPSETAARLPSLLSSVASIWLLYVLAQRLYDQSTTLVATALLAASPFAISFASTAFLDAFMGMWVLLACLAVSCGHWSGAGALLGLAGATKWEGLTFVPLVVGLGLCLPSVRSARPMGRGLLRAAMGLLVVAALVWVWDLARPQPSILWSVRTNYGGLALAQRSMWGERLHGWVSLLRFAFYHPWLNVIFVAGVPLLLVWDVICLCRCVASDHKRSTVSGQLLADSHPQTAIIHPSPRYSLHIDFLLVAFLILFLAFIIMLGIPVWDRYLLASVPFGCLLLARVLWLPGRLMLRYAGTRPVLASRARPASLLWPVLVIALLLFALPLPLRDAAAGRFPIGGDHGTYQGIEQVVAHFRGHVMGGAILYHRWLGNHYRFYMYRFPYAFRWWQTPEELAQDATTAADVERWIVFPTWQDEKPAQAALLAKGLRLTSRHQTYRDDGSLSFTIYQIEGP
jgi:4-amino-4-deoxy-L-arabinose transferase-like glycosyltransferase